MTAHDPTTPRYVVVPDRGPLTLPVNPGFVHVTVADAHAQADRLHLRLGTPYRVEVVEVRRLGHKSALTRVSRGRTSIRPQRTLYGYDIRCACGQAWRVNSEEREVAKASFERHAAPWREADPAHRAGLTKVQADLYARVLDRRYRVASEPDGGVFAADMTSAWGPGHTGVRFSGRTVQALLAHGLARLDPSTGVLTDATTTKD